MWEVSHKPSPRRTLGSGNRVSRSRSAHNSGSNPDPKTNVLTLLPCPSGRANVWEVSHKPPPRRTLGSGYRVSRSRSAHNSGSNPGPKTNVPNLLPCPSGRAKVWEGSHKPAPGERSQTTNRVSRVRSAHNSRSNPGPKTGVPKLLPCPSGRAKCGRGHTNQLQERGLRRRIVSLA